MDRSTLKLLILHIYSAFVILFLSVLDSDKKKIKMQAFKGSKTLHGNTQLDLISMSINLFCNTTMCTGRTCSWSFLRIALTTHSYLYSSFVHETVNSCSVTLLSCFLLISFHCWQTSHQMQHTHIFVIFPSITFHYFNRFKRYLYFSSTVRISKLVPMWWLNLDKIEQFVIISSFM